MAFEPQHEFRWRILGTLLVLAGAAVTIQFYRTLPEEPPVYILAYVPPAVLLAVGGLLTFGGISLRLVG